MNNALLNSIPDSEKAKLLKSDGRYFKTIAEEFADAWMKAWHNPGIIGTEFAGENSSAGPSITDKSNMKGL